MVADRSRTFLPYNYVSNSETQADISWQETDPRCRDCGILRSSTRLTPGRRKSKAPQRSLRFTKWLSSNTGLFLFGVWCFIALCGGAAAVDRQHPSLEKLARRNGLLVDLNTRPESPSFWPMERREAKADGSASSTISYAPIQPSTVTLISTGHPTIIATATPSSLPTVLPQVFDSNIGNNFTGTTCPTFFEKLITDSNFQECYPLSLLLTVSHCRINTRGKLLTLA